MKHFICFNIVFLLFISMCADTWAQTADSLKNEKRFLESEHLLAQSPIIYFIFNLKEKEVLMESRGVVLRKMKIDDMTFWGMSVDAAPHHLIRKSALFKEPNRANIDPNKNKEEENAPASPAKNTTPGAFNIDRLELKEMPTIIHLEFYEWIFISVRPKSATGFVSKLYAAANYAVWYVSRPILTIWYSIIGRPYTSIYLELSEEDARSIYWSIVENSENIIYQP